MKRRRAVRNLVAMAAGLAAGCAPAAPSADTDAGTRSDGARPDAFGPPAEDAGVAVSDASVTGGSLTVSGTVAHRSTVTITDQAARLGTRANVAPLYVAFGEERAGSPLGRRVGDYYHPTNSIASDAVPLGAITTAYRFDFKVTETGSWGQELFVTDDVRKPLLQYLERYYDFDITQPQYWSSGQLNLKSNRILVFPRGSNIYLSYQGANGPGSLGVHCEYTNDDYTQWAGLDLPARQWTSEEIVFQNSSDLGLNDGFLKIYRDNELSNPVGFEQITITDAWPDRPNMVFLDQVSNGCGDGVDHVYGYLGYMCFDDEYRGVYLGDHAERARCTKLIRLPQTAWSESAVSVQLVHSHLPLAGAHLHVRLGEDEWLESVPLS